jgi:FAD/FMN-containing dehydrogenase
MKSNNLQAILSSGTRTNANSTYNQDLFRALKGASNNLAIITHITLPLVPAGLIWGGFYAVDMTNRPQIFSYFENLDNSKTYDPYASLLETNVFTNGSWYILLHMAYTKPGAVNPAVYAPLLALPPIFSTLRSATHGNLTDEFEAGSPVNSRAVLVTMTFSNSASFMETFFQMANATALLLAAHVPDMSFTLSYQPWPQTITSHGPANGGNALGIDASDGDLTNIDLTLYWNDAADDDLIYAETQKLFETGERKAREAGVWNEYLYLNYADKWQNPIRGYGEDNVQILREVSRKYDPKKTFQKAVVGGFKLDE